jgi:hypothetical protein
VVLVVFGLLGLSALPASAGGPTSVLLASPTSRTAAALYNSGGDYDRLATAIGLERSFAADRSVPSRLGVGPGSGSINITWLMHDVFVWRVDRVQIEPDGKVWLNTTLSKENGELVFDDEGVWHQAAEPKQLVALLTKLGVWDGAGSKQADPDNAIVTGGTGSEAAPPAAQKPAPTGATTTVAASSVSPWWLAAIGLLGAALGLAIRPALAMAARFRSRGARQELIDA